MCKTIFAINTNSWALAEKLKMKLLSAMSAQVWVVVDQLFSRREEASDRGCGGWMFDVAACRLDGWRVCLCWPQGFSAGRSPRSFFLKTLHFRQWSPIVVIYQPIVQLLSKPKWLHSVLPISVSFTFLCAVYVWFCTASYLKLLPYHLNALAI